MRHLIPWLLLGCAVPAAHAAPPLALTHATLIDGSGSPAETDRTVVIRGERIDAVFASGSRPLPKDARVENLRGRYLIPGLIDAHVHLSGAESSMAGYRPLLRTLLRGGVTSIRDMAGDDRLLGYLALRANTDALPSPDIVYAALLSGPSFFAEDPRAQAASVGMPLGTAPWMQAIRDTTDIPLAVAEARGTGATGVKLYANLSAALVRRVATEAHRQGLEVWTHATVFPARPGDAVAAGADTISHSPYLVWEAAPTVPADYRVRAHGDFRRIAADAAPILALLKEMKARGTILDATVGAFRREAKEHPDQVGAGIVSWSYAVTRLAHRQGVLIDAGSDSAGLPSEAHGPDLGGPPLVHEEMDLLVAHCGFTPIEAIEAATRISAMAMGHGADRGTITAGKFADLVVLTADPSRDIGNTRRIAFVIKHGRIYPE